MKKKTKNFKKQREFINQWLKAGTYAGGFCENCGGRLILFFKYDAVCCPGCNQWIEPTCSDPECPYCSCRPQTPADALEEERSRPDFTPAAGQKAYCIRQYERSARGEHRKSERAEKIRYRESKPPFRL